MSRDLWVAVMQNAVDDIAAAINPQEATTRSGFARIREINRNADAAKRWFDSENDGVGSFFFVCDVLSLDPDAVRDGITERVS